MTIKDSGSRRTFDTGAERDITEDKGRCDLMPLDVVAWMLRDAEDNVDPVLDYIDRFQRSGNFMHLYDALENFLDHSHRGVIIKAYDNGYINPERNDKDVFAVNVLKTLFMIKYVLEITANIDNITSLMIENIDDDRIELKGKVEEALKVLMRQMLVQKNGELYVFLTDEEQEINREIDKKLLYDYISDKYSVSTFPKPFFLKVSNINNGTHQNVVI